MGLIWLFLAAGSLKRSKYEAVNRYWNLIYIPLSVFPGSRIGKSEAQCCSLCSINLSEAPNGAAADDFSTVDSRWETIDLHREAFWWEDGWRTLVWWHWFSSEGSLQVHVDAQCSRQQLLLVVVETHECIEDWRTAPIHPCVQQVAGAELGCKKLVVV